MVNRRRTPIVKQIVWLLVLAALGYGAYIGFTQGVGALPVIGPVIADLLGLETDASGDGAPAAAQSGRPPTAVDVAAARTGSVLVTVEAVGTARANEAVTITSEITGTIARLGFEENQHVKRGETLLVFDSEVERARLELAEADYQVRVAELENAQQLYDRALRLVERQNIPQARVDELSAELKAAHAAVKAAEAAVRAAQAELAKRRIVAPFAGRIGMRDISQGALVEPGDPVVNLDDISVIKLDFQVPERFLSQVQVGQEVTAITEAYPGQVFFGKVSGIDTRVDPVTRAVSIRALIDNGDELLKPGMFMLVEMGVTTRHDAVIIPEEAVVADGTARFVFVVDDGKAKRVSVELGQRIKGEVEVLDGVAAGQTVITGGVQKVRDGAAVAPRQETAVSAG